MARQTMAEALREEGEIKGRREVSAKNLLRLLQLRFGQLPAETVEIIQRTQDSDQLERWLDRIVTAKSLAEVGIAARE